MSEKEKRPLPREIAELFEASRAALDCRDEAIRSIFRTSKAIYYGKKANEYQSKAWKLVNELYPDWADLQKSTKDGEVWTRE
jgi:hypothetical protein